MDINLWFQFLPILLVYIVVGVVFVVIKSLQDYYRLKKRRSPFVGNFLRSPEESLRWKIQEADEKIIEFLLFMVAMPLAIYGTIISQSY